MDKGQFAILRFAKYKGPEISNIEAHNERTKEKYASNPDVDTSRSKDNFHIIQPTDKYRAMSEALIKQYECPRARSDSVRIVETLITASPEFFKGKKKSEIRGFFEHAVDFLKQELGEDRLISAVVHMDEKTPHMHVSFVPITQDGHLSAKRILGNRKTLTAWQDRYWKHMVSKYPELERGESASKTGREHIPPRVFKQAANLNKQAKRIHELLADANPFHAKKNAEELDKLLRSFIPDYGRFATKARLYEQTIKDLKADKSNLEAKNEDLKGDLKEANDKVKSRKLDEAQLKADLYNLQRQMDTTCSARWTRSRRRSWRCIPANLHTERGGLQMRCEVPVWEKANLTLEEAAAYSGIGINKLRELSDSDDCKFVLWVGSKRLLKRRPLEQYLEQAYSI